MEAVELRSRQPKSRGGKGALSHSFVTNTPERRMSKDTQPFFSVSFLPFTPSQSLSSSWQPDSPSLPTNPYTLPLSPTGCVLCIGTSP